MRKLIFLSALILFAFFANAQKTPKGSFNILNNINPANAEFIEQSILKSNMEAYRLKDQNVVLHFENGFDLELISAKTYFFNGGSINPKTYQETSNLDETKPKFKLSDTGVIVIMYASKETKYKK